MLAIVEGIDRVGKTTFCNMLEKELDFKIFKHKNDGFDYSKMDNENETDKMLQLIDLYEQVGNNSNIVFDRFHWSDFVYGRIERKYTTNSSRENFFKIDKKLKSINAIIVYVKPVSLAKSSLEHGKSLYLHNAYMEGLAMNAKPDIVTNFENLNLAMQEVQNIMNKTEKEY